MSINEVVGSKNFGDWSRWFLAYVLTSVTLTITGVWYLSGFTHDLANELASIHNAEKNANHKLDIILGVPGETVGLLPEVRNEQARVKDQLVEEATQRAGLSTKLDSLLKSTGENNPVLKRIEKGLNPPRPGSGE